MTAPTPWEACGCVIRDADSIEVCTVALWCKQPSEVAARIVRAVNAHGQMLAALERCQEIIADLDCECDEYHGFTCSIHSDREMVAAAIAKARQ